MEITKCTNKKEWDSFFLPQKQAEFLQFWDWGEFQERMGAKPIRLQAKDKGKVIYQAQGFEYSLLPFLKFVYFPKSFFVSDFLPFLEKNGYIFARVEPVSGIHLDGDKMLRIKNRQPQNTWLLDVSPSEEELFQNMHPKTRYNIKLAERKGVVIKKEKNIDVFWQLNKETFFRDRFKSHNKKYYEEMLKLRNCFQLTAYVDNEPIASNILVYFGDTVTYVHGASANKYRNLMAPYLLQWVGIKAAQKLGAKYYDFGGVSPGKKQDGGGGITCYHHYCWEAAHKWTGITRFKAGFGGQSKNYPQAVEVVFKDFVYKLYRMVRR